MSAQVGADLVRLSTRGELSAARRWCQPECFGYHATWRVMRRLGLKANPTWHRDFYTQALTGWQRPPGRPVQVLVCGAADETMLAVLATILGRRDTAWHLVDACRTPIVLAQSYAVRRQLCLTVQFGRAPEISLPDRYDIAVTDGLLSMQPDATTRDRIVAWLAEALTPDGLMLYSTRLAAPGHPLEYDRLGRLAQSAAARWFGPPAPRAQLAPVTRDRLSRPSPYDSAEAVRDTFAAHFTNATVNTVSRGASVALRLHHAIAPSRSSRLVYLTAASPSRPR